MLSQYVSDYYMRLLCWLLYFRLYSHYFVHKALPIKWYPYEKKYPIPRHLDLHDKFYLFLEAMPW